MKVILVYEDFKIIFTALNILAFYINYVPITYIFGLLICTGEGGEVQLHVDNQQLQLLP